MKITDKTLVDMRPTTTLKKIPDRQIFRGTLKRIDGVPVHGVFFKAEGGFQARQSRDLNPQRAHRDCAVVQLDVPAGWELANIWTWDCPVHNYEPLDVELVIHGRQK